MNRKEKPGNNASQTEKTFSTIYLKASMRSIIFYYIFSIHRSLQIQSLLDLNED